MSTEELQPITAAQQKSLIAVAQMRNALLKFRETVLIKEQDYGIIPGVKKPSLFKPGAEKLINYFKLSHEIETTDKIIDLDRNFISYTYKCIIRNPAEKDRSIGQCEGSANTYESKYRYLWVKADEWPPEAEYKKMIAEKTGEFRQQKNNGSKYDWYYKIANPEAIANQNTIQKMAQKRALVGAVLIATGASEFFTQDVEDMQFIDIEGTVLDSKPLTPPPAPEPHPADVPPPIEPPVKEEPEKIVLVGLKLFTANLKTSIEKADSFKWLNALWSGNPDLQKNEAFINTLSKKRDQLKNKK